MWYAVYDPKDGNRLLSVGSSIDLNAVRVRRIAYKEYADRPDQGKAWDAATLDFVAVAPVTKSTREQLLAEITDRLDRLRML